jgi:hypothetical protein
MRTRFGVSAALTLVLPALSGGSARAQQTTGSVAGGARDQTGGVLPGVSVELSIGTAITRSTETDGNGRYRIDDVPQGTYVVTFHLLNFGELERRDVVVSAGQVTAVDGVLALAWPSPRARGRSRHDSSKCARCCGPATSISSAASISITTSQLPSVAF